MASTSTLRRHVEALEQSTAARYAAAPSAGKVRRYTEFYDGAASWSRVDQIIARVEAGAQGIDTRFIVTNLTSGSARTYSMGGAIAGAERRRTTSRRGRRHLAADRTSCAVPPPTSSASFCILAPIGCCGRLRSADAEALDLARGAVRHLRLRLVKLAARVVELKTRVMLHLPSACPYQAILRLALERLPRLVC